VFLARAAAGVAAAGAGTVAIGGRRAAFEITKPEIPVRLARLPPELSGFRIAQLTDLHLGPILRERFLETVVEEANAARPDLIVVTGDLVDGSVEHLAPALAPLSKLRARCGIAFVTGNHEYYSGVEEWLEYLRARDIRVLMNERIAVGDVAAGGASFDLAGVPDHHGGRFHPDSRTGPRAGARRPRRRSGARGTRAPADPDRARAGPERGPPALGPHARRPTLALPRARSR
jgi:predicted MPP superfamily phosphohydrolase